MFGVYSIWHKYWRYDIEDDELKTIEKHLIDLNEVSIQPPFKQFTF